MNFLDKTERFLDRKIKQVRREVPKRAVQAIRSADRGMSNMQDILVASEDAIFERPTLPPYKRVEADARTRRGPNGTGKSRKHRAANMNTADLDNKCDTARLKWAGSQASAAGRIVPAAVATGASQLTQSHQSIMNKGALFQDLGNGANQAARLATYESERFRRGQHSYAKDPDFQSFKNNRLIQSLKTKFDASLEDQSKREAKSFFIGDVLGVADVQDAGVDVARHKLDALNNHLSPGIHRAEQMVSGKAHSMTPSFIPSPSATSSYTHSAPQYSYINNSYSLPPTTAYTPQYTPQQGIWYEYDD